MTTRSFLCACRRAHPYYYYLCSIIFLCVLGLRGCRQQPLPVRRSETLTLVSYNVENLFDAVNNQREYPAYVPGTHNWVAHVSARKIELIANAVNAARPDLLLLCEIENRHVLSLLQKALRARGTNLPHAAIADGPVPTVTCVALLSRLPIDSVDAYAVPLPDSARTRNLLKARIRTPAGPLTIFGVHWPSKRHPESWRLRAARVLLTQIESLPPAHDYIIAGDFNSNHDDHIRCRFSQSDTDPCDSTALHHLLGTHNVASGALAQPVREVCLSAPHHYDLWYELPPAERYSGTYAHRRQTLDHILLPAALYDSLGISYVDNSFEVYTWQGRLLKNGVPYRWQVSRRGGTLRHMGRGYSDHLPLRARFVCRAFEPKKPDTPFPCDDTDRTLITFAHGLAGVALPAQACSAAVLTRSGARQKKVLRLTSGGCLKNGPILLGVLPRPEAATHIRVGIRGSGVCTFRIRGPGHGWTWYNPPEFAPRGAGRYQTVNMQEWTPLLLPLPQDRAAEEVRCELRVKKGEPFELFLDTLALVTRL